jgi:AcrR family transcriptional regulator
VSAEPDEAGEERRAAKHEAILGAAQSLFSRYGFRRTSIDEIASEAGIAKGTVYLYFPNKQAVFRAVAERVAEHVLAGTQAAYERETAVAPRVLAMLEAKFVHMFEVVHATPHARELIDTKNGTAADVFERADRRYEELLARALAEADAGGELSLARAELSASAAAALVVRCAHGSGAGLGPSPSLRTYRKRLRELVPVLVRGLGG